MAHVVGSVGSALAGAVVVAVAHALASGLAKLAAWALGGLTHAATATTAVGFGTWFAGPWRAMLDVAGLAAVPFFFAGVIQVLARGEGPAGLARLLGRLLAAGAGTLVALGVVRLALAVVDVSAEMVEHTSGISLAAALARLGTALGVLTVAGGGGAASVGGLALALLAGVAALVLWIELVVRTALVYVATAFLPLALAGLVWPATAGWLRRLAEVAGAVIVSKLVIVVVLILGAAALTAAPLSLSSPGADLDAVVSGIAFLGLATFGLPIALRLVPAAAEAALHAGRGSSLLRSGLVVPGQAEASISGGRAVVRRLGSSTSAGPAAGATTGTPAGTEGLARSPRSKSAETNGSRASTGGGDHG